MPVRPFGLPHFVPAYHEKQNLKAIVGRDLSCLPLAAELEIVFVDDASRVARPRTRTC